MNKFNRTCVFPPPRQQIMLSVHSTTCAKRAKPSPVATFIYLRRRRSAYIPSKPNILGCINKPIWDRLRYVILNILLQVPNQAIRDHITAIHTNTYAGTKDECRRVFSEYLYSINDACPINDAEDDDDDIMSDVTDALIIYLPKLFNN